jgi:tRNA(fMet)-specific endonuclease VapC
MYALDTNTLIYFFKGLGNVADHLLSTPPKEIAVPTIVIFELEVGLAKTKSSRRRKKKLQDFVSVVRIMPFGYEEARCAASIRVELESQGQPIGPYDTLIAASALAHNFVLVTHNTREFKKVKNLRVVDWY